MVTLPSSLVAQLPFSSLYKTSRSRLAAFVPVTTTRSSQLLRCIRLGDCCGLAIGCCNNRDGYSLPALHSAASLRGWSPTSGAPEPAELHSAALVTKVRWQQSTAFTPLKVDLHRWRFSHQRSGGYNSRVKIGAAFGPTERMTSVALRAGGRQLRERKSHSYSVSTQAVGRKKAKEEAGSTDDDMLLRQGIEESAILQEYEARLWDLHQSNKLGSLTVLELRGYMKMMSKPTAGRKDELISTVKEWLASRGSAMLEQTKQTLAIQETSSDAESLEGALLRAESKNREAEAEAMSRRIGVSSKKENGLREDLYVPEKPARQEVGKSATPNGKSSRKVQEVDKNADDHPAAKAVARRKNQSSSVAESHGVGSVVLKVTQRKRRKLEQVAGDVQEETRLDITQKKIVEVIIDPKKPWLALAHKKPSPEWVVYDPETMRPSPLPSSAKYLKLLSWNVNGLRGLMKDKDKKAQESQILAQFAKEEGFDVLCLQETKLQEKDVEQISASILPEYSHSFWSCSTAKLGYSGTALISRVKPLSVKYGMGIPDHDKEGRLITAEFDDFYLVTGYVPNSGDKLVRLGYRTEDWDPSLSRHLKELEKKKPVIYTGDLNCANDEIDINNPDGNRKSAGFTDEERESFKTNFLNKGFVDTFRHQHPNVVGYTYWGYRTAARPKNNGWRLDYFLASEALMNRVHDSYIRPDILGSDHCPIGLILKL
ncbi:hypothetical protein R1sor_000066 [Riccia sorocarpa]|uniref:DNA-(apurinic or apyrimidinic site) endonuclease n=1 Tax=Riccia sorocarpa TaxID=122646 RepID=A0ABD3GW23_9MARC